MTVYDADAQCSRRILYDRAVKFGWTQAQFEYVWRKFDALQQEVAWQLVQAQLLKYRLGVA